MKRAIAKVIGGFMAAALVFQAPATNTMIINGMTKVEASATTNKKGKTTSYVCLRKTASNSARILKVLPKGASVTVISTKTVGWYKVKVGSMTGYVGKTYVTFTTSTRKKSTVVTSSSSKSSGTGAVNTAFLNLRKSASNSAKVLRVLSYGTKVTIKATTGSWYKVKVGSTTGYVAKAYIRKGSAASTSSYSSSKKVTSSSVSSSAKGQQVINYASKFVGNRYVWGGTSLTNGADCSGFTQAVYKHFGYSIPRTSYLQRTCGKYVASLAQAQPGDLICYEGHVALYMGNNKILHAANSRRGIVKGDKATYTKIVAIRRVV